jgi:hypothetical protein
MLGLTHINELVSHAGLNGPKDSDIGSIVADTGLTFSGSQKRARRYFD